MKELTYILGAGASYQSIPIVKTFSKRFREFITSVENMEKKNFFQSKDFFKDINDFHFKLKSHYSFDTYFKKLFHKSLDSETLKAKKILNLFFLWEHLQLPMEVKQNAKSLGNDLADHYNQNTFIKEAQVDNRYDSLIAGLIKPLRGEFSLFSKINFITWNYDLNLIYSIKNFVSQNIGINEYIQSISTNNDKIWECKEDLKIINMNGYFYSSRLKDLKEFSSMNFAEVVTRHFPLGFKIDNDLQSADAEKINFAWENYSENDENPIISEAKNAISRSQAIIVIGYTFPLYNRLTDFIYFNSKSLNSKTLYIQDPNAEEIIKRICNDFSLNQKQRAVGDDYVNIETVKNCDSFFVPNDIFKMS